jgi:hypothetical protein
MIRPDECDIYLSMIRPDECDIYIYQ